MPKYIAAIARPTMDGWERHEIGNFIVNSALCSALDPDVAPWLDDTIHIPIQKYPTHIARNTLIKVCQERKVDFLMMLDVDGAPAEDTFKAFFTFLRQQSKPSVIAAPYVSADGRVQVMRFMSDQPTNGPLERFALMQYPRELAATRTGIEPVASIGTHCIMFDMRCFSMVPPPYFAYQYDQYHTQVLETEDCWCMRQFFHSGIPIYCHWDYPARHWKEYSFGVPPPLDQKDIPKFYIERARELVNDKGYERVDEGANPFASRLAKMSPQEKIAMLTGKPLNGQAAEKKEGTPPT